MEKIDSNEINETYFTLTHNKPQMTFIYQTVLG